MKLISAHWKAAMLVIWSVVAVVELLKANFAFGAFATLVALITLWGILSDRRAHSGTGSIQGR
ncbi:MAG: hypothetical protein ACJ75T_06580 [Solirubrobacterales bacterium]